MSATAICTFIPQKSGACNPIWTHPNKYPYNQKYLLTVKGLALYNALLKEE